MGIVFNHLAPSGEESRCQFLTLNCSENNGRTACPPTPPPHTFFSTCKHIPGGRTKKSDVREKRKQACSVEEDESFAPYQEATSPQKKDSTCREKLLPRVARSAVFSCITGPLLKPCRRPNLKSAGFGA